MLRLTTRGALSQCRLIYELVSSGAFKVIIMKMGYNSKHWMSKTFHASGKVPMKERWPKTPPTPDFEASDVKVQGIRGQNSRIRDKRSTIEVTHEFHN